MPAENRGAPRFPFVANVELVDLSSETQLKARVSDLSATGCYVDSLNTFPAGTRVRVKILHGGRNFTALGTVTYTHANMGMGINFSALEPESQATLERWLAESGAN